MPTLSVKLADETKARIDKLAEEKGVTPHAFMVGAIEAELERAEAHHSFIADALRAREEMLASGKVYDGQEVLAYLRARSRGESPPKPKLKPLKSFVKKAK